MTMSNTGDAAYGQGYADGKDKAHMEVRTIATAGHAWDCGCEPCITARAVLIAYLPDLAECGAPSTPTPGRDGSGSPWPTSARTCVHHGLPLTCKK